MNNIVKLLLVIFIILGLASILIFSKNAPKDKEETTQTTVPQETMNQIIPTSTPSASITSSPSKTTELKKTGRSLSAWEWRTPTSLSPSIVESTAKLLKENNITTVFLDISEGIDSYDVKNTSKLDNFNQRLRAYVKTMQKHNISVHGLTGDKQWSDPDHVYLTDVSLEYVFQYNRQSATNERLTGIQFDIEPFSREGFGDSPKEPLENYLKMVKKVREGILNNSDNKQQKIAIGFAIPYWLDGQNGNIPKTHWNNKEAYLFYHISDELNAYDNSYLALMSYRNYAAGENGTIDLSQNELNYTKNQRVKIYVGQELNNEEPAKITFFNKTKTNLMEEIGKIDTYFKGYPNYQGVSLHEVKSFLELR